MARPRSEDKRIALLQAATHVVAEEGLGAATARISRLAGVAEGTLFTYFATKDALLNALYVFLKGDLRDAMMGGYPCGATLEDQARHAWDAYIAWGISRRDAYRALQKLITSEKIDAHHRALAAEGFEDLHTAMRLLVRPQDGLLPEDSLALMGGLFNAMAQTVMEFILQDPARADAFRTAGFRTFWATLRQP